jgi:hypothetical protein
MVKTENEEPDGLWPHTLVPKQEFGNKGTSRSPWAALIRSASSHLPGKSLRLSWMNLHILCWYFAKAL